LIIELIEGGIEYNLFDVEIILLGLKLFSVSSLFAGLKSSALSWYCNRAGVLSIVWVSLIVVECEIIKSDLLFQVVLILDHFLYFLFLARLLGWSTVFIFILVIHVNLKYLLSLLFFNVFHSFLLVASQMVHILPASLLIGGVFIFIRFILFIEVELAHIFIGTAILILILSLFTDLIDRWISIGQFIVLIEE
jgi:hypothetical protein